MDRNVALRTNYKVGDEITVKTIQGTKEQLYILKVVGITDGRQYSIQPSIIVSQDTFALVKPGLLPEPNQTDLISNIIVVRLNNPAQWKEMAAALESQVGDIKAVDKVTAYENTPGYGAQQSTLSTQNFFSLLIGLLVIGGFFQIQTLQKVPQIGMLKAIGAPNTTIALAALDADCDGHAPGRRHRHRFYAAPVAFVPADDSDHLYAFGGCRERGSLVAHRTDRRICLRALRAARRAVDRVGAVYKEYRDIRIGN